MDTCNCSWFGSVSDDVLLLDCGARNKILIRLFHLGVLVRRGWYRRRHRTWTGAGEPWTIGRLNVLIVPERLSFLLWNGWIVSAPFQSRRISETLVIRLRGVSRRILGHLWIALTLHASRICSQQDPVRTRHSSRPWIIEPCVGSLTVLSLLPSVLSLLPSSGRTSHAVIPPALAACCPWCNSSHL